MRAGFVRNSNNTFRFVVFTSKSVDITEKIVNRILEMKEIDKIDHITLMPRFGGKKVRLKIEEVK